MSERSFHTWCKLESTSRTFAWTYRPVFGWHCCPHCSDVPCKFIVIHVRIFLLQLGSNFVLEQKVWRGRFFGSIWVFGNFCDAFSLATGLGVVGTERRGIEFCESHCVFLLCRDKRFHRIVHCRKALKHLKRVSNRPGNWAAGRPLSWLFPYGWQDKSKSHVSERSWNWPRSRSSILFSQFYQQAWQGTTATATWAKHPISSTSIASFFFFLCISPPLPENPKNAKQNLFLGRDSRPLEIHSRPSHPVVWMVPNQDIGVVLKTRQNDRATTLQTMLRDWLSLIKTTTGRDAIMPSSAWRHHRLPLTGSLTRRRSPRDSFSGCLCNLCTRSRYNFRQPQHILQAILLHRSPQLVRNGDGLSTVQLPWQRNTDASLAFGDFSVNWNYRINRRLRPDSRRMARWYPPIHNL